MRRVFPSPATGCAMFLNIDNRKMSKSLGNFFTVRDISKSMISQVLRAVYAFPAHYRSPLNFSADLMEAAKIPFDRIRRSAARLKDIVEYAGAIALLLTMRLQKLRKRSPLSQNLMKDGYGC